MDFIEIYRAQVIAACIVGSLIGVFANCRFAWLLLILPIGSGTLALAFTGDWEEFFKNGFTLVHLIYLTGYCLIAVFYFGIFGLACGSIVWWMKYFLRRRQRDILDK